MRSKLLATVAFAAAMTPACAFAQSTGSTDVEEIVVTGSTGPADINGIQLPETPKAKAVITQELIERRAPGQTIFDTINLIPSVSFTNADPYGASGGNIRIRGFDGARISATFDGLPTNDSGNYALYTNQVVDPELIQQVNVNFGSADVDSPTASAAGGTVNYRTINPLDERGAAVRYSRGTNEMNRVFGVIHTGEIGPWGTKAFVSASSQRYNQFRGPGELKRWQINGKIYQPLGGDDFVAVAGHYNRNRNNFYSNPSLSNLRDIFGTTMFPRTGVTDTNPIVIGLSDTEYDRVFNDTSSAFLYARGCALPSGNGAIGTAQNDRDVAACGNLASTAINPSNTGNVRMNSRFSLSDRLTLTVDAGYQYTKATGGGSTVLAERNAAAGGSGLINYQYTRVGAGIAAGADLNGDGDLNDFVRLYTPSITRTNRLTAIVGLRYDLDDDNLIRVAYTWDRARHRQTGEASNLLPTGRPNNPFGAVYGEDYQVTDAAGNVLQKRNRLSYAILHQISGEYRGTFFEDSLNLTVGVRAPFFRRNLNNYCYTIRSNSSEGYCTSETPAQVAALIAAQNATVPAPATPFALGAPYTNRIKTYSAVLPNVGLTYNLWSDLSVFASYSKGFSAPRTDNLYSFDDVTFRPTLDVLPEKTDAYDLGLRYSSRLIQAQLAAWYIKYNNRIISSTIDLEDGAGTINADRNVGKVDTKGVDFSLGIQPIKGVSLYGFVSYTDSELKENAGTLLTAGKFVVETPEWQYGGRAQVSFNPISVGMQVKHTGDRFVTDVNDIVAKGYTVVDLDARLSLAFAGLEKTFFQLNVSNLFNEKYFGNLTTTSAFATGTPRFTFGAPRTVIGSVNFEF